jgi:hypothetical protein
VADRQATFATPPPGAPRASLELIVGVATLLPPVLVGVAAGARLTVPTGLCQYFDLTTLACVGVLSYVLGSWTLLRRLRHARRWWVIAVILYDLAMPLVLFGVVLFADARIPCR